MKNKHLLCSAQGEVTISISTKARLEKMKRAWDGEKERKKDKRGGTVRQW